MNKTIDTDRWSNRWRGAGIDLDGRRILVTDFRGTEQEPDLREPPNCGGLGRIRHFQRSSGIGWPPNPLPIDPACKALGIIARETIRAQVFQNAVCNWRCWYCFVPFDLLSANNRHSAWLTVSEMLDLYLKQPAPPQVLDLSGGQPDLTPEWIPWTLREIRDRELEDKIFVWSDDNLSTDYFWRYLSDEEIDLVRRSHNYGRVCCFKGFDEQSFAFNTLAEPSHYDRQFELFKRFVDLGVDVYAYVTLTTPNARKINDRIRRFVDRLQSIHSYLPLRTVPLEVQVFSPVRRRLGKENQKALEIQELVVEAWNIEIDTRFTKDELALAITDVDLRCESR